MNGTELLELNESRSLGDAHTAGEVKSTPVRIWMVDDNSTIRSLVANLLNEEEGLVCERQFSSPAGILEVLTEENAPDVVLLDIQMGEYNGLDAIAPIKNLARRTHVLMLTTLAGPDARARAFREGASDFLLKSWSLPEIVSHIRQAVEFGPVAGLITAFMHHESVMERPVQKPVEKRAPVKQPAFVQKTNGLERLLAHLRGFLKLSPS
jgi:CheY-like chemotaxis protein